MWISKSALYSAWYLVSTQYREAIISSSLLDKYSPVFGILCAIPVASTFDYFDNHRYYDFLNIFPLTNLLAYSFVLQ